MLVIVNLWTQRVPCGTSPKLWTMTGGGVCSRFVAMSGRKNLFAHGATCGMGCVPAGGVAGCGGCPADAIATHNPPSPANQYDRLIRCLLLSRVRRPSCPRGTYHPTF